MKGYLRNDNGKMRTVMADAKWQDLRDTPFSNYRKRTPQWAILFSLTTLEGGSTNNRMTRGQAEALVSVLTRALATGPDSGREFIEYDEATGDRS